MKNNKNRNTGKIAAWKIIAVAAAVVVIIGGAIIVRVIMDKNNKSDEKAVEETTAIETTAEETTVQETTEPVQEIKVGDYVSFGSYEQDNDLTNGKEDIEWLVLDEKDGKYLLFSKYIIDAQPFLDSNVVKNYSMDPDSVTWADSYLREWLNTDFMDNAFSADEQSGIALSTISNYKHKLVFEGVYETMSVDWDAQDEKYEDDTQDSIFLLSLNECKDLDEDVINCEPTKYVESIANQPNLWRLRTIYYGNTINYDSGRLSLGGNGSGMSYSNFGIRPALWVDSSSEFIKLVSSAAVEDNDDDSAWKMAYQKVLEDNKSSIETANNTLSLGKNKNIAFTDVTSDGIPEMFFADDDNGNVKVTIFTISNDGSAEEMLLTLDDGKDFNTTIYATGMSRWRLLCFKSDDKLYFYCGEGGGRYQYYDMAGLNDDGKTVSVVAGWYNENPEGTSDIGDGEATFIDRLNNASESILVLSSITSSDLSDEYPSYSSLTQDGMSYDEALAYLAVSSDKTAEAASETTAAAAVETTTAAAVSEHPYKTVDELRSAFPADPIGSGDEYCGTYNLDGSISSALSFSQFTISKDADGNLCVTTDTGSSGVFHEDTTGEVAVTSSTILAASGYYVAECPRKMGSYTYNEYIYLVNGNVYVYGPSDYQFGWVESVEPDGSFLQEHMKPSTYGETDPYEGETFDCRVIYQVD